MKRLTMQSDRNVGWPALAILLLLMVLAPMRDAAGATIYVTTKEDTIKDVNDPANTGCSLKEAIFSANFDDNVAIQRYENYDFVTGKATPVMVRTACVPGHGDDIIVLPSGETLVLTTAVDDAANPFGPTGTPMITSNITIEGNGATLQGVPDPHRLNPYFRAFAVSSTGNLTLKNIYVKDFAARGGNGASGGGGGLGAGGAVFVHAGGVFVENSAFANNVAQGGNGAAPAGIAGGFGGGGGGLGGDGGKGAQDPCTGGLDATASVNAGGGGGSSAFGNDGIACLAAGSGGGTVELRFDCGGLGGGSDVTVPALGTPGQNATCDGGGGGGGQQGILSSGNGGNGRYGGGGGGGANGGGNGGTGGFGGGGGAGWSGFFGGTTGGDGGFGGGGGAGPNGTAGGGNAGRGMKGGGNASNASGGGGAALGGAIFSDFGSVVVKNSTFYNNIVNRGVGGGSGADNGGDGGGAIFSHNGSLTVQNVTIASNQSTGSGGGIVVMEEDGATTVFTLENSIIYNNGSFDANGNLTNADKECSFTGSVTPTFVNNLIQHNDNCGTPISTDDPLLGPLQKNGGSTPTMAIPKSNSAQQSPAWNTADPDTSLGSDQRGQSRPAMGGFDIGAFELCLDLTGSPCIISPTNTETQPLVIQISPVGTGTTTPAAGNYNEPENSVVALQATANLGYHFLNWSGGVAAPANPSTTVVMDQPRTVTASFAQRDFSISPIASLTIPVDGEGSRNVIVNSLGDFSQAVDLSSSGQPLGITATLSRMSVTPAVGGSINSTLSLKIGPSVTPQTFTLTVTGSSGLLTHSVTIDVTVLATTDGITQEIGTDVSLLCIDSGIANSLTSKLAAAQASISSGDIQSAINTLTALLNELYAQAGRHIKSSCTDKSTNQTFDADAVLIAQVKALLASLGANLKPNPVMGYAVNSSNVGVAGATVSVVNSAKSVVASATTDATGFYFFAKTSVFTIGATYTVKVTPPKPYKSATSSTFNWQKTAVTLTHSVVN